jgi:hypothetical protein
MKMVSYLPPGLGKELAKEILKTEHNRTFKAFT